jgi:hypothetical protein
MSLPLVPGREIGIPRVSDRGISLALVPERATGGVL